MTKRKPPQWRVDLGNAAGLFGLSLLFGGLYVAYVVAISGRVDEKTALLTRLSDARAGRGAERLIEGVVVPLQGQALPASAGIVGWSPSLVASQTERRRESQLGTGRRSSWWTTTYANNVAFEVKTAQGFVQIEAASLRGGLEGCRSPQTIDGYRTRNLAGLDSVSALGKPLPGSEPLRFVGPVLLRCGSVSTWLTSTEGATHDPAQLYIQLLLLPAVVLFGLAVLRLLRGLNGRATAKLYGR